MTKKISLLLFTLVAATLSAETEQNNATSAWYQMPENNVQTRWYTFENQKAEKGQAGKANFGRKGAPNTPIKAGETVVLADIQNSGTIRRMWFVLWKPSAEALRGLKLEMYWDGAGTPAVQAPFGDFLCQSLGRMSKFENACFSSPEGRSFNCFIPMPFRKSAKILLKNESKLDNYVFYEINSTIGDKHDEKMLYFHSYWRRENPTQPRRDMEILPKVSGKGRFLGCHLGIRQSPSTNNFWWGEGEFKVYLDGDDTLPTLCGTGTEDYIGAGYGQGLFDHLYQGNHYLSEQGKGDPFFRDAHGFYRFHIPDPIYFYADIRVTIQVMGGGSFEKFMECMDKDPNVKFMKTGDGTAYYTRKDFEQNPKTETTVERIDDYCATAYWYMDKPENGLKEIACFEERIKDLDKIK